MAASELKLPGKFEPGKLGPVRHDLLADWRKALLADRALPGPGLTESQTPQGRVLSLARPGTAGTFPPFHVELTFTPPFIPGGDPIPGIIVRHGHVIEMRPGPDSCLILHEVDGLASIVGGAETPIIYPATPGQAIAIEIEIDAHGRIESCSLLTLAAPATSTHYQPAVGSSAATGTGGTLRYPLATIAAPATPGGPPRIIPAATGSHIVYFQELPRLLSTNPGGPATGIIPSHWDNLAAAYILRALTPGTGKTFIETRLHDIVIRGSKKDAALTIREGDSSPTTFAWSDGLLATGTTVEGTEDPPAEIDPTAINIPVCQPWGDPDAQIQVANIGIDGTVYQIRGNAKNGTLRYLIGSTPTTVLEWKDGLIISDGVIDIPIHPPGSSGLPPGTLGQMLYHNGTDWVPFGPPAAPASGTINLLTHNGTAPAWVNKTISQIAVCDAGTPATWDIIRW